MNKILCTVPNAHCSYRSHTDRRYCANGKACKVSGDGKRHCMNCKGKDAPIDQSPCFSCDDQLSEWRGV